MVLEQTQLCGAAIFTILIDFGLFITLMEREKARRNAVTEQFWVTQASEKGKQICFSTNKDHQGQWLNGFLKDKMVQFIKA